jgi:hypothetical protein
MYFHGFRVRENQGRGNDGKDFEGLRGAVFLRRIQLRIYY